MKNIMFVDDEPAVLEGLEDLLHGCARTWNMVFICGGEAAIEAMNDAEYDVVVSDIRMPGVSGVNVLEHAKDYHPKSMRIALTGYSDDESTIQLTRLAQRYLRKPCSLEDLDEAISRDCGLIEAFDSPVVKELTGKAGRLPGSEGNHDTLLELLNTNTGSVEEISSIVEQDVALTVKVLQLVNSSFFRRQRSISSASEALNYLGMDVLRSLILANQMFEMTKSLPEVQGFDAHQLQKHCVLTSTIARELVPNSDHSATAFTAGLLHDVGKIIIALEKPELLPALLDNKNGQRRNWVDQDREREILGCTHAEVGGCFLNVWGLPTSVVEAVTFHDNPAAVFSRQFDAVGIVHISNYLAHWSSCDSEDERNALSLNMEYLEDHDVSDQLELWKEQASDAHNG